MKNWYLVFSMILCTVFLFCCCKDDEGEETPEISEAMVSVRHPAGISTTSFSMEVTVDNEGGGSVSERGICYATHPYPTVADEVVSSGTGKGTVMLTASDLSANTLYYVEGFATNEKGTSYTGKGFTVVTSFGTVTDFEGNEYSTVKIGDQVWMRENLKSTKYSDGTDISGVYPAGGLEGNVDEYGRWYTWYAVMHGEAGSASNPSMVQGVCPDGFHLPSDAEWKELEVEMGMSQEDADVEGYRGEIAGKLKVKWQWLPDPNLSDNTSGFSCLPSGYRNPDGSNEFSFFWGGFHVATEGQDTSTSHERLLTGDFNGIWRVADSKKYGLSVRCVKDE